VLEAAVKGDPAAMPGAASFRSDYAKVLTALRATFAEVITTTIPDPFDTAYFSSVASVAQLTGVASAELITRYGLKQDDWLTPHAIFDIGAGSKMLPPLSVVSAGTASEIRSRLRALNAEISSASRDAGAVVCDLNALLARLRSSGLAVGNLRLTANYMGGLYSLSGSYPGMTVHAVIANEILTVLNQTYGTRYELVDAGRIASRDPAVRFRPVLIPEVTR